MAEADLLAWFTYALDTRDCSRVEFTTTAGAEDAQAWPWTWPAETRDALRRAVDEWVARNPERRVVCVSYGVSDDSPKAAVMIVHHLPKTQGGNDGEGEKA